MRSFDRDRAMAEAAGHEIVWDPKRAQTLRCLGCRWRQSHILSSERWHKAIASHVDDVMAEILAASIAGAAPLVEAVADAEQAFLDANYP